MKTLLLLIFALCGSIDQSLAQPLRVFLSPTGDDAKDGLTAENAITSLARAQEIIAQESPRNPIDTEVRIAAGTYPGQTVRWTFFMPDHTVTFAPAADDHKRPIFDGGGKGTWFTFTADSAGARTNLVFRQIEVRNYQTAIGFHGNRNHAQSGSRGNTVDGCVFSNIGEESTAAIRFVNSSENRIENSYFVSIVRRSGRDLLHVIYAAHHSTGNQILRNRFQDCCGDVVRFRDGSDGNTVEANSFVRAGSVAAVSDWFCDHDVESVCTKPTAECPSWNNIVKANTLHLNFAGAPLAATKVYSNRMPNGCSPPAPAAERFLVSGNLAQ